MADRTLGTGFRFTRVMAWAPAIVLVVAFLVVIRGEILAGIVLAVGAILFWLIVRRRKAGAPAETPPRS